MFQVEAQVERWGLGSRGQLGMGSTETKLIPTHVSFIKSHVYQIVASGDQTLALLGIVV